jgi:hypothetical protein
MVRSALALASVVAIAGSASANVYVGVGGAIPDSPAPGIVSTIVIGDSFQITDLTFTILGLTHTWAGDLVATVTHVDSGISIDLFHRVGRVNSGFGDSSDFGGDYRFGDGETGDLWAAAAAIPGGAVIPGGGYRTSGANSSAFTSILALFAGVNVSGTWQLKIQDFAGGDTGAFQGWEIFAVPAPGALALLGLAGLAGRRRRA